MTLGLAVSDGSKISLAIESKGLFDDPCFTHPLESKIVQLPGQPHVALLAAGGLDHWYDMRRNYYAPQPNLQAVCVEIVRLLDGLMNPRRKAFGLLCGFEDGRPACYRINRFLGTDAATVNPESLSSVQPIGDTALAGRACAWAEAAITKGAERTQALKAAIESLIAEDPDGKIIHGPVSILELVR